MKRQLKSIYDTVGPFDKTWKAFPDLWKQEWQRKKFKQTFAGVASEAAAAAAGFFKRSNILKKRKREKAQKRWAKVRRAVRKTYYRKRRYAQKQRTKQFWRQK